MPRTWNWVPGIFFAVACGPLAGVEDTGLGAQTSEGTASDAGSGGEGEIGGDETTDAPPICGDGVVDPGEDCDDGDVIDGNGCNVDCVSSGQLLWSDAYDSGAADYGHAVAIDGQGRVYLAVTTFAADGQQSVAVRSYDPDGTLRWHSAIERIDQHHMRATALVVNDFDAPIVAIASTTADDRSFADLVGLAHDGSEGWRVRHPASEGTRSEAVGLALDADGQVLATGVDWFTGGPSSWWLDAYDDGALAFTILAELGDAWLGPVLATADAGSAIALLPLDGIAGARLRLVGVDGASGIEATLPCGRTLTADEHGTVWAIADDGDGSFERCGYALEGSVTDTLPFGTSEVWPSALAMAPGGDTFVAGYLIADPSTPMRLQRRTPTGAPLWTFTPSPAPSALPFAITTRAGVVAVSTVTLGDSNLGDASLFVLSP